MRVHPLLLRMSCAYLIETDSSLVLVDAGPPGFHRPILQAVAQLEKELQLIFITHAHFDHYGSAAAVRKHTGAKIAVHTADAQAMAHGQTPIRSGRARGRWSTPFFPLLNMPMAWLRTPADILLEDGEKLDLPGLAAYLVHAPGHTAGSSCLVVENGTASPLAFTGDLVVGGRRPHLQSLYADVWSQLPASLARIQALHPHPVYTGHSIHPIDGDVFRRL